MTRVDRQSNVENIDSNFTKHSKRNLPRSSVPRCLFTFCKFQIKNSLFLAKRACAEGLANFSRRVLDGSYANVQPPDGNSAIFISWIIKFCMSSLLFCLSPCDQYEALILQPRLQFRSELVSSSHSASRHEDTFKVPHGYDIEHFEPKLLDDMTTDELPGSFQLYPIAFPMIKSS